MPDSTEKTGTADRIRINVGQAHERAYWCRSLRVSQKDLKDIVDLVGPMVKDVKEYLIKRIRDA